MAFDPNSLDKRWYLKVYLDEDTLCLSTLSYVLTDGTVVQGYVTAMTPLRRSAGSLEDPRIELPTMQLTVRNRTDQSQELFSDLLDAYEWGNRQVDLVVGHGSDPANYETIWVGRVRFPGDSTWTDETVTIRLVDARAADARYLPATVFDTDTYPHLEAAAVDVPIPIVYGDFTSGVGTGVALPAYQIDATAGTGGRWKVAGHALAQLEAVYRNGSSVSFTPDLAVGEFVLNVTYTPGSDVVTVHCQGATDDGTPTGTLLQAAPDIFRDLYVTHLEVASDGISAPALAAWAANLGPNDHMRRWIGGEETDSNELVAQLLLEGFADLSIRAGIYAPAFRVVAPDSDADLVTAAQIQTDATGRTKVFSVERSPETVYCNETLAYYEHAPVSGAYARRYLAEDEEAIERLGVRYRRVLHLRWLYKPEGARDCAHRHVRAFAGELELATLKLGADLITKGPGDQLRLVYAKYGAGDDEGVPFQLRQTETDPLTWSVSLTAWNMYRLLRGTWTEDAAVTWLTATAMQRFEKGFWTDDDGYADTTVPPDGASRRYRWS